MPLKDKLKEKGKRTKRLRVKHIPQRTCIGCREVKAKRELVRIVRTPDGQVEIDPTGKRSGRGAYIHRERECWFEALERRAVERALKLEGPLPAADRERMESFARDLGSRSEAPAAS